MKKVLFSLLFLTACAGNLPTSALHTESLVSTSDEKVSFPISDAASVKNIEQWIGNGDMPSSAELSCRDAGKQCKATKAMLKKHKIAYKATNIANASDSVAVLVYNHINARDCAAGTFGCATSVNSLKMVTDRRQITQPALSDLQDAAGAVKAINKSSAKK